MHNNTIQREEPQGRNSKIKSGMTSHASNKIKLVRIKDKAGNNKVTGIRMKQRVPTKVWLS